MPDLPIVCPVIPAWCSFRAMPSLGEAAEISAHCRFSLATLEVSFNPATMNFALTEQEHAMVWRWAIISPTGAILAEGREVSQQQARIKAEAMLRPLAA